MNFVKKVFGFGGGDLKSTAESTKIQGALYRVIKDARNIIFKKCTITFEFNETEHLAVFINEDNSSNPNSSYAFPFHAGMNLVSFNMNKQNKTYTCFQWSLDQSGDHVGCYVDPKDKDKFKQIACKIIKSILNDENIKDHLKLCKDLPGIPVYKTSDDSQSVSSLGISSKSSKVSEKSETDLQINKVLINQAAKPENRMVHSASYYEIVDKQRKLIKDNVVFSLKEVNKFEFQFQLLNASGFTFLRKELTPGLIYEVNTDLGYVKWMQTNEGYKVVQINFGGKRDAAMALKFAIIQCQYEMNTKKKLQDVIAQDEINYMNRLSQKVQPTANKNIVKIYQHKQELQIAEPKFVYGNQQATKGLEKYRTFCQAKINNFDVAALGSMIQTLKISEDNKVAFVSQRKLKDQKGKQFNVDNIILHDGDQKALLNDSNGQLHYYDLEKGGVIQTYDLSQKGIQDVCPEYKLADMKQYKTFKAVSPNTIYQIDPRLKEGSTNLKSYQTSPQFNRVSVDCKGRYAVSSTNGQIRLFDQIGKNANCKYPGLGDPVLHLQSTKDGRWLLATFKTYLLLLPTQTQDQISLYQNKIKINERPRPIKLTLKLEHLQLCKVAEIQMVPAKFDESKGNKQMFIVSGFGQYVVIWNLAQVIRGNVDNYKFTHIDGELVQTQFMFDNVKKLIMTTKNGIVIKENKVKS